MHSLFRKSLLAIVTVASVIGAGAVAPAAAQGWGGWDRGGWHRGGWDRGGWDRGWGGPRHHHHHWYRERCWIEYRPVRVFTPWGPRWEQSRVRICR